MFQLMQLISLEWKKNRIEKYIRHAIILAVVLGAFLFAVAFLGIANDPDTGVPDTAPGYNGISSQIELLTSISFLAFSGVMFAAFIVSAYKNKTMHLMFLYPIKRQKILISQMAAVWIFNFVALVLTKLWIYVCISLGGRWMAADFLIDFQMGKLSFYGSLLVKSVVTVTMGFIALFVGLSMKSSRATIVASFLLIFLTQGNIGDFSMAHNGLVPVILIFVSLGFAAMSVWHVETKDLM